MIRKILFLLAFVGIFTTFPEARSQSLTSPVDRIVAVVDEDIILRSELDQALSGIRRQYQGRENQLPPPEVLERQVLERLTLVRLQLQRAEGTGVKVTDTEVDDAISRILQQNQIDLTQLQAQLRNDGFTLAEFRKTMRDELLVQKLRQRVIESRADVSPSELEIALASGVHQRGEARLSVLLIGVPDGATSEQIETARGKVEGVRKLLDEGKMDFAAAAIRYSDAPQALEGGDLGWRRYDQIPPNFADLVGSMQVGEVSQPVRTPSGFYLLKVTDKRANSQIVVTEFNARKILVKITELQDADAARREIDAIYARLKRGEDFEKLARELSEDDASAPLGGDIGWFALESLAPEFAEMVSQLKDGDYSEPFRDPSGWQVIQRVGTRTADRTEEFQRGQVKESLRQRKGEEAYEQFLRQLRGEAYIDYRLAKG
ncbi:MAG: peptidylprolyl isomerase [Xanthomonadales bacterium]|nr:Chaperone SurA [Xanthomonadales bacterium]MCC6594451.1 peptidylprolyl isomerase [Xanthomonadales bacterium]